MTTTTARRDILEAIRADIRKCSQAEAWAARGDGLTWREQALERAGELFTAGYWAESREAARKAREE